MKKFFEFLINLPKNLSLILIKAYQLLLSPDHSWLRGRFPHGFCRHYPSCSEYSKQAIERFGFTKGLGLSIRRVLSCHPWAESKVDPVPKAF